MGDVSGGLDCGSFWSFFLLSNGYFRMFKGGGPGGLPNVLYKLKSGSCIDGEPPNLVGDVSGGLYCVVGDVSRGLYCGFF